MSTKDRFGEKPSAWPKLVLAVVTVSFFYSLLNHVHVLDMIYFKATGKHEPAWFTPAPGSGSGEREHDSAK
jgi:hypothetical protein